MDGELTLHVKIRLPSEYFTDGRYESAERFVYEKLKELAEGLEGTLYDVEIK